MLRQLDDFVIVVPGFTAGWVLLIEGRKEAVSPFPSRRSFDPDAQD